MTICFSKEECEKNSISISEFLLLLIIENNVNLKEAEQELINKGYITAKLDLSYNKIGWRVTNAGADIVNTIIVNSSTAKEPEDKLEHLAKSLKEIFPKGKKDGTNLYWTEGIALIIKRLKLFFKKYGVTYTDDEIISAAKNYVSSFNGSYQYMKTLKYFIFKDKVGVSKEIEGESDLINYIENAGQEEDTKNDWTSTLK